MGSTKQSGTTSQTTTATPEERQMEALQLQQFQAISPYQTALQKTGLQVGNQLLQSFQPGSQNWNSLLGGVTPEQQQSMVSEADRYLKPGLQAQGIYDSGMAATARMRSATDIYNQNAQFNVGAMQNALNLALSGQAQVQSPVNQGTSMLGSQLAGLRSISGQTSQTSNPFLNSFYTSMGKTLGSPSFSMGPFSF